MAAAPTAADMVNIAGNARGFCREF